MTTLQQIYTQAYADASGEVEATFDNTYGGVTGWWINATNQTLLRAAPGGEFGVQASVNFRNNIRMGDNSVTPLHFVYEAADCRFFYTPEMYTDQTLVWDMAYQLAWGNATCVAGSTNQPSSKNGTAYINLPASSGANNTFGANDTSVYPSGRLGPAVNATATATSAANTAGTTSRATVVASSTPSVQPFKGGATNTVVHAGLALLVAALASFVSF